MSQSDALEKLRFTPARMLATGAWGALTFGFYLVMDNVRLFIFVATVVAPVIREWRLRKWNPWDAEKPTAEKVAKLGLSFDDAYTLFVRDGAVWRTPKDRPHDKPEKVADGGFEMERGFRYFVDVDGDVSRARL